MALNKFQASQMEQYSEMWAYQTSTALDKLIWPLYLDISTSVDSETNKAINKALATSIVLAVCAVVLEIVCLFLARTSNKRIRDVLVLLLHVPQATLLKVHKVA
jgi:uncharacterized Tic20 family protein